MGVFLVKRILSVIPILLLAVLILTGLIHLSPVDPAQAYLSAAHIQPTDELLAAKRAEFGLDQPFYQQYFDAVIRLAQLDFGTSYLSGKIRCSEIELRQADDGIEVLLIERLIESEFCSFGSE